MNAMAHRALAPFLLLPLATAAAPYVALVGAGFEGYGPAELAAAVQTDWRFLPEVPAPSPDALRTVEAVIELANTTPAALAAVPNARWYAFEYTGISDARLALVPQSLVVTNCHQAAVPIAEYVLANILEIVVNVRGQEADLRNCTWRSAPPGNTCQPGRVKHRQITDANLTVGVIGYGSIGRELAARAAAIGLRVVGTTLNPPASPPAPLAWLGSDSDNGRLVAEASFVVAACPLTNSTKGMVGSRLLEQMRPDGWLINIARGAIVDQDALWHALQPPNQQLAGAVLDVWWNDFFELPAGGVGPKAWPSRYRFDLLPNVSCDSLIIGVRAPLR